MASNKSKPNLKIDKPIILVGMMGVGKSSVGRRLAEKLNIPFVDADDEIEAAANRTIADIFEEYGEDYFRDGERRVIARLMDGKSQVIATGGGAFINEETRSLILGNAISVWLDADIEILVERVIRRNHRPLLKDKSPDEVRDILLELQEIRRPIYAQANHRIMSNSAPHDATVEDIMKALDNG